MVGRRRGGTTETWMRPNRPVKRLPVCAGVAPTGTGPPVLVVFGAQAGRPAELREGRLHDARHTAATVLLVLGIPDRVVIDIMGWSNTAMAKRYQHITGKIRRDVAERLDGLIWDQATDGDDQG